MTACNDWAGLDKQGKPAVFSLPENMTERLLKLCVALVSHADKILLVIGGPAHVWGQSQEWDDRVADQVAMVNSWGVPCHWGEELTGAYTVPGENLHLDKSCRDLVDRAWQAWISQAREPLLKTNLSSGWQRFLGPIKQKLMDEEDHSLGTVGGEQRIPEYRECIRHLEPPKFAPPRPMHTVAQSLETRKSAVLQRIAHSVARVADPGMDRTYDAAELEAKGLCADARVRLQLLDPEQEQLSAQEFIVEIVQCNILMFRVMAESGKYLRIKPKNKKNKVVCFDADGNGKGWCEMMVGPGERHPNAVILQTGPNHSQLPNTIGGEFILSVISAPVLPTSQTRMARFAPSFRPCFAKRRSEHIAPIESMEPPWRKQKPDVQPLSAAELTDDEDELFGIESSDDEEPVQPPTRCRVPRPPASPPPQSWTISDPHPETQRGRNDVMAIDDVVEEGISCK